MSGNNRLSLIAAEISLAIIATVMLVGAPPAPLPEAVSRALPPAKTVVVPPPSAPEAQPETPKIAKPAAHAAVTPSPAPVAPIELPPAPPGTVLHVAKRGDTIPGLARAYVARTSFMTAAELEAALRAANGNPKGDSLPAGQIVIIPGVEGPIHEQPVKVARDYQVRAIYLTGLMAGSPRGIEMIRRWHAVGGNAVVFDVKDSDGIVNIRFEHELNSWTRPYISNLPKFVHFLHGMGMHAIARIAIFRDERLVQRHPDLAVRSRRSGQAWQENGKLVWTDPSRPEVQQYNLALAERAAREGVDEIQFDYVRFPAEGDQKDAQFSFEAGHQDWQRSDVIADFLSQAYAQLHPLGVLFSLDVFGVMAWQRTVDLAHTGQDIVKMAKHCDVLSPMIYPSHFFGMDGYAKPGDAPEHFISESMERFKLITNGSGVVLRPWLQAFAWRTKTYSPGYILTQVSVARESGGIGFLFWNARNDYSKPFAAMPEMARNPERFFGVTGAAAPTAKAVRAE